MPFKETCPMEERIALFTFFYPSPGLILTLRKQTKLGQGPCIASSTSIARRTPVRSSLASPWSSASPNLTIVRERAIKPLD